MSKKKKKMEKFHKSFVTKDGSRAVFLYAMTSMGHVVMAVGHAKNGSVYHQFGVSTRDEAYEVIRRLESDAAEALFVDRDFELGDFVNKPSDNEEKPDLPPDEMIDEFINMFKDMELSDKSKKVVDLALDAIKKDRGSVTKLYLVDVAAQVLFNEVESTRLSH